MKAEYLSLKTLLLSYKYHHFGILGLFFFFLYCIIRTIESVTGPKCVKVYLFWGNTSLRFVEAYRHSVDEVCYLYPRYLDSFLMICISQGTPSRTIFFSFPGKCWYWIIPCHLLTLWNIQELMVVSSALMTKGWGTEVKLALGM